MKIELCHKISEETGNSEEEISSKGPLIRPVLVMVTSQQVDAHYRASVEFTVSQAGINILTSISGDNYPGKVIGKVVCGEEF